ncbi:MAG: nucleoside hydrolase [Thermaerobacter sp.]|nr:nucleoside hydrolase [Thermaerobacter sp.]
MHMVIDTDTAGDDVVSLMVALQSDGVSVAGITINAGNVAFDQQVENALKTLEVIGMAGKVPVYPGARQPLLREWVGADYVHGKDGMGEAWFSPVAQRPEPTHAVTFLLEASQRWPGELVIVAQAPLTNLALAVRQDPGFASRVRKLWVMGGTNNCTGNIAPLSEYNFFVDPEAAAIVFAAGFNLFLVGWEIALRASILGAAELDRIRALDTPFSRFFMQTQRKVLEFNQRQAGIRGTTHPDSLTMAMAIDETLWQHGAAYYVGIETRGELTRGTSVVDQLGVWKRKPNAQVCLQADGDRFKAMLATMLETGHTGLSARGSGERTVES